MAAAKVEALASTVRCLAVALLVLNIIWLDVLGIIGASIIVCCSTDTEGLRRNACCAQAFAIINFLLNLGGIVAFIGFGAAWLSNSEDMCQTATENHYNIDDDYKRHLSVQSTGVASFGSSTIGLVKLVLPALLAATSKTALDAVSTLTPTRRRAGHTNTYAPR